MIKNLRFGGRSNTGYLALALLMGAISAILIGIYLSSLDGGDSGDATSSVATTSVVVAVQDIPAFTRVTEGMLTVRSIPTDLVLTGSLSDPAVVAGQVTQVPVIAGEQVVAAKVTDGVSALAQYGSDPPLSLLIPDGMRGFSVALSAVASAGGLARPGDHVDILLSGSASEAGSQALLTPGSACYIVQDIEVLAVGSSVLNVGAANADGLASSGANADASSATLAVTPEQAWWLAAAQQGVSGNGVSNQLWMSLRPFGDQVQQSNLPLCGVAPGS